MSQERCRFESGELGPQVVILHYSGVEKGSYLKVAGSIFHISKSDLRNWMKPCMLVSHVESGAHAKAE